MLAKLSRDERGHGGIEWGSHSSIVTRGTSDYSWAHAHGGKQRNARKVVRIVLCEPERAPATDECSPLIHMMESGGDDESNLRASTSKDIA